MRKRKWTIHLPSLLIGILIGAILMLILLLALPGPRAGAQPSSPAADRLQVRLDQAAGEVKSAWSRMVAGLDFGSQGASASQSCLNFRAWFNRTNDRLVSFLALHGILLPRWQMSLQACSSSSPGTG